ncbi:MAG: hypothetical protein KAT35_03285 [Candidatus Aenigmarchaeota archaeon]|nr:hypothetical protein [Candidatus Aenigmarchaeota archaeon]
MELSEDYAIYTVLPAKDGMPVEDGKSESYVLPLAEYLAKILGYCLMFEGDNIFRRYENGEVVEEH